MDSCIFSYLGDMPLASIKDCPVLVGFSGRRVLTGVAFFPTGSYQDEVTLYCQQNGSNTLSIWYPCPSRLIGVRLGFAVPIGGSFTEHQNHPNAVQSTVETGRQPSMS